MKSKLELIDHLAAEIIASNVTPELKVGAKQLVMGDGNPDADMVLMGEAPGKKEDETGVPFVGAAGRFLDSMLEAAGLSRQDVYITNIVKYRPPDNRDPSLEEKQEFWPYLMRQLEIIQPKVVITLGRHSASVFLPDIKISEAHGQVFEFQSGTQKFKLIPLYHPAAALYRGSMRQVLMDDFLKAHAVAKEL